MASGIRVYSRAGCHLCEELIEALLPLVRDRLPVEVVDIDTREDWRRQFDTRVPVVEYEGRTICQHRLDEAAVLELIGP